MTLTDNGWKCDRCQQSFPWIVTPMLSTEKRDYCPDCLMRDFMGFTDRKNTGRMSV